MLTKIKYINGIIINKIQTKILNLKSFAGPQIIRSLQKN